MPIFEYVCNACHKEFEEIVLGGEQPVCPACGAADTTKLMSRGVFRTGGPIVMGSPSANAITTVSDRYRKATCETGKISQWRRECEAFEG